MRVHAPRRWQPSDGRVGMLAGVDGTWSEMAGRSPLGACVTSVWLIAHASSRAQVRAIALTLWWLVAVGVDAYSVAVEEYPSAGVPVDLDAASVDE